MTAGLSSRLGGGVAGSRPGMEGCGDSKRSTGFRCQSRRVGLLGDGHQAPVSQVAACPSGPTKRSHAVASGSASHPVVGAGSGAHPRSTAGGEAHPSARGAAGVGALGAFWRRRRRGGCSGGDELVVSVNGDRMRTLRERVARGGGAVSGVPADGVAIKSAAVARARSSCALASAWAASANARSTLRAAVSTS
jgi:hypothetical protein